MKVEKEEYKFELGRMYETLKIVKKRSNMKEILEIYISDFKTCRNGSKLPEDVELLSELTSSLKSMTKTDQIILI